MTAPEGEGVRAVRSWEDATASPYWAEDVAREVATARRFVERNAERGGGYRASVQEVVAVGRLIDALRTTEAERARLEGEVAARKGIPLVQGMAALAEENQRLTAELAQARNMLSTYRDHMALGVPELLQADVVEIDDYLIALTPAAPRATDTPQPTENDHA